MLEEEEDLWFKGGCGWSMILSLGTYETGNADQSFNMRNDGKALAAVATNY